MDEGETLEEYEVERSAFTLDALSVKALWGGGDQRRVFCGRGALARLVQRVAPCVALNSSLSPSRTLPCGLPLPCGWHITPAILY